MQNYNSKLYIKTGAFIFGIAFFAIFLAFSPLVTEAGLVPCGGPGNMCEVCHLYTLANNVIRFMLWDIATPLLVVALLAAGFFWLTSAGSEEKVKKGKSILFSAVVGFIIVFGAWLIVNTLLTTLGYTSWTDTNLCSQSPIKSSATGGGAGAGGISSGAGSAGAGAGAGGGAGAAGTGAGMFINGVRIVGNIPMVPVSQRLTHLQACTQVEGAGIDVRASGNVDITCNNATGATTLEGAPSAAVQKLVQIKQSCNCTFVMTGATETAGHGTETEHAPGRGVFDLVASGNTNFTQIQTAVTAAGGTAKCERKGSESSVPCSTLTGAPGDHIHIAI